MAWWENGSQSLLKSAALYMFLCVGNDRHKLLWYMCQKVLRIEAVNTCYTAFGCSYKRIVWHQHVCLC